jgi:L-2-amino-thiazoline-4-carboxylic acid hydrolase-like protein
LKEYKKYFQLGILHHYPENYSVILDTVANNYSQISLDTRFSFKSKNPIDRRLDFSAYFLALIVALDKMNEPYEKIKNICLEIVTEYVKPKNEWQAFLKRLPPKIIEFGLSKYLIKAFNKRVSRNENPDGFIANIITDKDQTYGFGYGVDILECGICKLFSRHGYQRYASILCEVDKVTSSLAGLQLIRSGTIALGASKCDFRFKRIK